MTERRQAETELERLAAEQAALRRVATLIAREASQVDVFTAIAEEIGQLVCAEEIRMLRYEGDRGAVVVAGWGEDKNVVAIGSRHPLGGENAASRVFRTGRPTRIDDYGRASGPIAQRVRSLGISCVVATPIVVEGGLWGAMVTGTTRSEPLPPETESRLGQFTELMATAIANTESRARADRLAEEHAALRRVATLVAKESAPAELFAKVAEEAATLIGGVGCALLRDEGDGTASVVAAWGAGNSAAFRVGTRLPADGDGVLAFVLRQGRARRIDDYPADTTVAEGARQHGIGSAVGCPIVARGSIWGAMVVARFGAEPLPTDTETRMAQFADLMATAVANAEVRAEVDRLAEEQAALRRVATLVAQGASPGAVLDAVAAEMQRALGADGVTLSRYEPDEGVTVLAHRGSDPRRVPPGTRVSHHGENVTSLVRRSERAARVEHRERTHGAIAELVRNFGVRASVGAPIVVDGRLWGVAIANWRGVQSPPADTEERMAQFAQLLDTAIANADGRAQLTASRARLLTEADEARRRMVEDLHRGAQQRFVQIILTLQLAQQALREEDGGNAESRIGEALEQAEKGNAELGELAHGILPAALTRGGLRAGVAAVVRRLDLPVEVDVPAGRFPAEIEASAYFIVAEALTNVVKHSHARRAQIRASVEAGMLHVQVRDDGIGGADPDGHGLVGIGDRVTALGGRLTIESPASGGTLLTAELPLSAS